MLRKLFFSLLLVMVIGYAVLLITPIDPDERRPGTRLTGTLATAPVDDFSFHPSRELIWVQASTWYGIPHSITTTSFVVDGTLYVPCGRCSSKTWPQHVAGNPDVLVKIKDTLYPLRAERVTDKATLENVFRHHRLTMDDVWLFRMTRRSEPL